jgi:hypothetical protein
MFLAKKLNNGAGSPAAPEAAQFNYVTMLLHGDGTNGAQNNTFLDSSTNNFTITRNGNTTQGSFSPYGSNWSNYFDGTGDYLTTSSSQIIPTGSFTVECFVFITGSGNNQKFVSQGTSGTAGRFSVGIEGGNWWVQLGSDAVQTGTPVRNQWNYVAATFNGSTLSIYVNGSLISSVSTSTNAQNTTLTIGQDWNSYTTTGYISNVRVSNTVRTVTTTPTAPFTSDGNTRLLACQSNRFLDSSANAFALTVNGNPSVQRFNPFGTSTAYSTSVIGGSGYFDGSGDYLSIADNAALDMGSSSFTIEGWFLPTANVGAGKGVFGKRANNGVVGGILFYFSDPGVTPRLLADIGGSWGVDITASSGFTLGQWNHFATVRNSNTWTIYINGTSVGSATNSGTVADNSAAFTIMAESAAASEGTTQGYISNFRVVKGTAVYTSAFTPSTTPLTAITNTSLLLSMTNGAIFDNAMMNDLETVGNAQISTSVKKYGTGSLAFDGTGDYLVSNAATTDLYAFGVGDFTIEFWAYLNTTSSSRFFYDGRPSGSGTAFCPTIYWNGSTLEYYVNGNARISGSSLSTGTWYHIAVARSGTSTKMFVNGTQTGSTYTDTTTYANTSNRPIIGGDGNSVGSNSLNGYMDDVRITKGYARYTANFTPPTSAFSDTGPV